MKIKLKNFRFHEDAEFEIPDSGLILISGNTGKGKSTILNAICYAFYGKCGRSRSPYTHGKTTCRVDLEYKKDGRNVYITRTSHPNTLVVKYKKGEYEDDAAQGVIDMILGINYDVYMASSYIIQQTYKSVLFMTPAQQLEFVEKLTFNTDDHIECRQKFKSYTKECQTEVVKYEEHVTILKSQLQSAQDSIKHSYKDIPDLGDLDPDKVKDDVQNIKKTMDSLQKTDRTLSKKLKEIQEEENTKKTLVEEKTRLETELSQYKKMREEMGDVKPDDEVDNLEKKLQKSKRWLEHTRAYMTYNESLANVGLLEEEYFGNLKLQVSELKKVASDKKIDALRGSYQEYKDMNEENQQGVEENMKNKIKRDDAIVTVKRILKEVKKLYDISAKKPTALLEVLHQEKCEANEEIVKTKKKLDRNSNKLKQQTAVRKVYQCPGCSSELAVLDETLIFIKDVKNAKHAKKDYQKSINANNNVLETINNEITQLDNWIKSLEDAIPSYKLKISDVDSSAREEFEKIEKELKIAEDAKTSIKNLSAQIKSRDVPPSILKMKEDIETKKKFPDSFVPKNEPEELQTTIEKLTSDIESSRRLKGDYSRMSREMNIRQENLKNINKRLGYDRKVGPPEGMDTVESITTELNDNRKKTMSSVKKLSELQEKLEIVSAFDIYQKDMDRAANLKSELKEKISGLKVANQNLEAAHGLEQTVKEAEILALEKTLTNINEHAKVYLETMSDIPISVRLENHKADKKDTKLKMNVVVIKHGKTYNSVDELCGGESQTCNLAFLLAVNAMVNSPLLILDECLNFLDGGANMEILTYLRGVADKRLVLVVSHEAIKGSFDDVVEI